MDILNKYKQAWENQPEDSQKVSRKEIFKMMHAKSSSVVKWIFIIGLLEFVLLNSSAFFIDLDKVKLEYEKLGLLNFVIITSIIMYCIVFYFIYKFYINYKKISTTDDTRQLMNSILKTRKTVKNYVLINLVHLIIYVIIGMISATTDSLGDLSTSKKILFILLLFIGCAVVLLVFWLFYQLLYGILLKKLNRNYKELAKLDELN